MADAHKLELISRLLENALKRHRTEIDDLAEEARQMMLPYFRKRGWSYTAGNGTWFMNDAKERAVSEEKLPTWIRDLLYLEAHDRHPLGFYIQDIKREDAEIAD
jgi:hypothetical protein